jgi:hypothetical protein
MSVPLLCSWNSYQVTGENSDGQPTSANLAVPDLAMVPRLLSRSSLVMPTPVSLHCRSTDCQGHARELGHNLQPHGIHNSMLQMLSCTIRASVGICAHLNTLPGFSGFRFQGVRITGWAGWGLRFKQLTAGHAVREKVSLFLS